nr:MAG TPA: hypothetical protein [Caudoviricetes sp.]
MIIPSFIFKNFKGVDLHDLVDNCNSYCIIRDFQF